MMRDHIFADPAAVQPNLQGIGEARGIPHGWGLRKCPRSDPPHSGEAARRSTSCSEAIYMCSNHIHPPSMQSFEALAADTVGSSGDAPGERLR